MKTSGMKLRPTPLFLRCVANQGVTGACVPRPRDFEYTLSQDLLPLKSNDDAKRSRWMAFGRANGTSDPMSGVWLVRLNGTRAARDYGGLHWNTLNGAGGHEGERDGNMEAFAKDRSWCLNDKVENRPAFAPRAAVPFINGTYDTNGTFFPFANQTTEPCHVS